MIVYSIKFSVIDVNYYVAVNNIFVSKIVLIKKNPALNIIFEYKEEYNIQPRTQTWSKIKVNLMLIQVSIIMISVPKKFMKIKNRFQKIGSYGGKVINVKTKGD